MNVQYYASIMLIGKKLFFFLSQKEISRVLRLSESASSGVLFTQI